MCPLLRLITLALAKKKKKKKNGGLRLIYNRAFVTQHYQHLLWHICIVRMDLNLTIVFTCCALVSGGKNSAENWIHRLVLTHITQWKSNTNTVNQPFLKLQTYTLLQSSVYTCMCTYNVHIRMFTRIKQCYMDRKGLGMSISMSDHVCVAKVIDQRQSLSIKLMWTTLLANHVSMLTVILTSEHTSLRVGRWSVQVLELQRVKSKREIKELSTEKHEKSLFMFLCAEFLIYHVPC